MEASEMNLADGEYTVEVTMEGGSGRASIQSPTELTIENGQAQAEIIWSSSHYDYMMVNGDKYLPVNTEGNSTFEIPVSVFDEPMTVIGDICLRVCCIGTEQRWKRHGRSRYCDCTGACGGSCIIHEIAQT